MAADETPAQQMRELPPVDEAGYAALAQLRAGIRSYLAWAEQRAGEHGLTPAHVQLALAIRAHDDPAGPTLTELSDTLLLKHNSVVGLVDRAEQSGMVRRAPDPEHGSRVHVQLTDDGAQVLESVSRLHLEWLRENGAEMARIWSSFER